MSHSGLTLDRLDLQLYPLGTGVAQNIRKGPGRIQRQIENSSVALNIASRENNPEPYAIFGRIKHMTERGVRVVIGARFNLDRNSRPIRSVDHKVHFTALFV